jgi:tripartite-type tricarboxylate transporter receptor subunit TctC
MSEKRFAIFPDVPPMAEAGYPGLEDGVWYGLSGPAGIQRPVVDQIYKVMLRVLASPDVVERFATVGSYPMPIGPKDYEAFIIRENKKWGDVVRAAGIAPD